MKKLICLMLSVVLIFSMSAPAFAKEVHDETVVCKEITFEEAVKQTMNYDGISYEEAKEKLLAEEERILTQLGVPNVKTRNGVARSNIIQYYDYEKVVTYNQNSNFQSAIGATIRTFLDDGSTRYIDDVMNAYTRRVAGLYNYTWIQLGNVWYTIASNKRSVEIGGSGYFEVTVDTSSSVELPGFSGSVGTSRTYLSNTMSLSGTYYS